LVSPQTCRRLFLEELRKMERRLQEQQPRGYASLDAPWRSAATSTDFMEAKAVAKKSLTKKERDAPAGKK
jgi:hypothetical protein